MRVLPMNSAPDEPEDELISPHQPFAAEAPKSGVLHPLVYVCNALLQKATERDENSFLKLKPYGDMSNADGWKEPQPVEGFRPHARAVRRGHKRAS